MRVVFANTLDEDKPSGGLKQAYRHIDVLNQLGIDACFAHPTPGFRYSWFPNQTRTVHTGDIHLTADDFLIYGELVSEIPRVDGWDRCGKVILCQNDYNALTGFRLDLMNIRRHYREASAVLCPSENAVRNIKFMFPSARVMRFRYSFDRGPWEFFGNKEKIVAVMPRKRSREIGALVSMTQVKWVPAGWTLYRIDGVSEKNVANILKRCAIFASFSEREGFGMPPCFLPGQKVWTGSVQKNIENVKKGDLVMTHTGRILPVTMPMSRRVRSQIAVMKISGTYDHIRATKEHPIFSIKANGRRPDLIRRSLRRGVGPEWHNMGSLVSGDYVVVPMMKLSEDLWHTVDLIEYGYKPSKFTNHGSVGVSSTQIAKDAGISRSVVRKVLGGYDVGNISESKISSIKESAKRLGWKKSANPSSVMPLNDDTGFLVGQYISEGCCSVTGTIEFASHLKEQNIRDSLLRILRDVFGLKGSQSVKENGGRIWVCCRPLALAFENLCGKGAYHKRMPIQLMLHNKDFARGVIRGAWLGDGYVDSKSLGWSYTTMSEDLACGMRQVLTIFGILASLKRSKRGEYVLDVSGRARLLLAELLGLPANRKKRTGQAYIESDFGFLVPIRTMDFEDYSGDVYNMEVAVDSSYCVNGVASHNCEAMVCGCVVVGYTGYAGDEYMLPGISFPVADGDFLSMGRDILNLFASPMDEIIEIGYKASTYIKATYSTKAEVESIKTAWEKISRPVIEIHTETRDRMRKEVAAYMPVYNEGPYMETLLRWLLPRVGAIFVAESIVPWSPNARPGGESKAVVDKVLADYPEAKDIIRYIPVGNQENKDKPLTREADQRNEILQKIQDDGFKFVWMVEADEFYRNDEAEALWAWFFDMAEHGARTANCRWHTYWRSPHWRVEPAENFRPNVAYLSSCRFDHGRVLSDRDEFHQVEVPDRVCIVRHYSWARTPADVRKKLSAWGHSKETNPKWFDDVFMVWTPGAVGNNLHPTNPQSYKSIVRCDLPIPEAMEGHPFLNKEIITDDCEVHIPICESSSVQVVSPEVVVHSDQVRKNKIKAVIIHHDNPKNADRLFQQLAPVFDDVEIFDNGSDPNRIPIHVTRSRENVYWTGTWNEVMATCSDYDAVWVLGCDIELKNKPEEYREAISSSLPFGCWSPCIDGRAHPFMQVEHFKDRKPLTVRNIEGMALAMSGALMKQVGELVPGSKIGFGQDFWLCYRSRKAGMKNIIDGRVVVYHPEGIGYDEVEALRQMDNTFGKAYGADFRRTIFEYDQRFEYNVVGGNMSDKKFTIITVDNGWGLAEFIRITEKIENARRIVMRKGVIESIPVEGIEFVPYNDNLEVLIQEADVAFFPRVGAANKQDYLKLIKAGVAVVVRDMCSQGAVEHMKNGWVFREDGWAVQWLSYLRGNPNELARVRKEAEVNNTVKSSQISNQDITVQNQSSEPIRIKDGLHPVLVTVITPTYQRSPEVIRRCVGSMLLQTEKSWEQLVCSDGEREEHVVSVLSAVADSRIKYTYTFVKKEGDFGNTVRAEMLKAAQGKYVLFFDDDNVILPHYLKEMVWRLENAPDCEFAVCKVMHFGPLNEKEVGKPPKVLTGDPVKLYHIDPLQVLVRRETMQKIGWDMTVGYLSDGVTLEKLAPFKCVRVDQVLGVHM